MKTRKHGKSIVSTSDMEAYTQERVAAWGGLEEYKAAMQFAYEYPVLDLMADDNYGPLAVFEIVLMELGRKYGHVKVARMAAKLLKEDGA